MKHQLSLFFSILACCVPSTSFAQKETERFTEQIDDPWLHYFVTNGCSVRYSVKVSKGEKLLDGPFLIQRVNGGKLSEGSYKNGAWDGELKFFHTNGHLSSCQWFKNGKAEGTEIHWGESGMIQRLTRYINGAKDGIETYWSSDERVVERIVWSSDQPKIVEVFDGTNLLQRLTEAEAVKYLKRKAVESVRRAGNRLHRE